MLCTLVVSAQGNYRRDEIKSHGTLIQTDGGQEVALHSSDLLYLADEMDMLEEYYKLYSEEQYEQGKEDGKQEVLHTVYESTCESKLIDGLSELSVYAPWNTRKSDSATESVNIPITNGLLYSIVFNVHISMFVNYYADSALATCNWTLSTVEGETLSSGTVRSDDGHNKNDTYISDLLRNIDLLSMSFSTDYDYLVFTVTNSVSANAGTVDYCQSRAIIGIRNLNAYYLPVE